MATLRETRDRIRSVNSTKKITKAQELIATSRITKAQQRVDAAAPYSEELKDVMARLAGATSLDHVMLTGHADPKVAAILVVTSDRGMAGGYNTNVLKAATELEETLKAEGKTVVRYVTGGKGIGHYKFREQELAGSWTGFSENPSWEQTHDVRRQMITGYEAGHEGTVKWRKGLNAPEGEPVHGFDSVHVVYTAFESMLSQKPTVQQLLPVETVYDDHEYEVKSQSVVEGEATATVDFEPDAETLMDELMPKYVSRVLYSIYLEAAAAESASRRNAMKSATDNATDLVEDLTRIANAARQAQITQEITEIIGGAGALSDSGESD